MLHTPFVLSPATGVALGTRGDLAALRQADSVYVLSQSERSVEEN